MKNNRTSIVLSLAAVAMAAIALTSGTAGAEPILMVDFGSAASPVEDGFVGQSLASFTHSTTAGDLTVAVTGIQGFYDFGPPSTTGSNVDFYRDFIFKNGGTITMVLSGPAISASAEYDMTFWSQYQAQPRNTTFAPGDDTLGPNLGPIALTNDPATGLDDPNRTISGTYTSNDSGLLTILVGGTTNRPALNGFTITAVDTPLLGDADGDDDVDAADYIMIKTHFGGAPAAGAAESPGGDIADGEGNPGTNDMVDWYDLQLFQDNYNSAEDANTIPEPMTMIILAAGLPALLKRRRRRG